MLVTRAKHVDVSMINTARRMDIITSPYAGILAGNRVAMNDEGGSRGQKSHMHGNVKKILRSTCWSILHDGLSLARSVESAMIKHNKRDASRAKQFRAQGRTS